MHNLPTHAAKAVIQNAEGKILFLKRSPSRSSGDSWDLAGGLVEVGEEDKTALRREIQEELGVDAMVGDELGRWTFHRSLDNRLVGVTNYSVKLLSTDIRLSEEHVDFRWVSLEEMRKLPVKDVGLYDAVIIET